MDKVDYRNLDFARKADKLAKKLKLSIKDATELGSLVLDAYWAGYNSGDQDRAKSVLNSFLNRLGSK